MLLMACAWNNDLCLKLNESKLFGLIADQAFDLFLVILNRTFASKALSTYGTSVSVRNECQ